MNRLLFHINETEGICTYLTSCFPEGGPGRGGGGVLSPLGPLPDGDISSSWPLPVYTDDTS